MGGDVDIAVVGGGAAGLLAGIQAGRAGTGLRVAVLDGAARLGAKIRISGGGRCNVTHDVVREGDFAGASPNAIRKVLRQFDVEATISFFTSIGVELRREETGKLFPVSNRSETVVDALLAAVDEADVALRHPFRVESIERGSGGFRLVGPHGRMEAGRVVLATGGRSVPETGSDGAGYEIAKALGHTLTERVVPALVPLVLPEGHPLTTLRGIAAPVTLEVRAGGGKRLHRLEGALLLTHFGVSGPAALDVSRHWILAKAADPDVTLCVGWLPGEDEGSVAKHLQAVGRGRVLEWMRERFPQRLAQVLMDTAGVARDVRGHELTRETRRALGATLTAQVLPVLGTRGWAYAEVTAGGVPLTEVRLETMASRVCEGLYVCGEILDVDGRIGGFNFQWAWASGTSAGRAAAGV